MTLRRVVQLWEHPLASSLLALTVYTLIAWVHGPIWTPSANAYYNYLADAFLHGQLSLRRIPQDTHDLSLFRGRLYLYWGPLPAVVLMPFVLLFGVQVSDIVFTLGVAAVNVGLVALLLRRASRRLIRLSRLQRSMLVLFFAFGTVHLPLAPFGRVWFTGQLIGFCCVTSAYLATISLRGLPAFTVTGLALAGAMLTRNHLLLAGVWPACYLLHEHRFSARRHLLGYVLAGSMPIILAAALIGLYNYLRFGSVFDAGLDYHRMAAVFINDYRRYGPFSLHYLPTNVFYQYLAYPYPIRPVSFIGGSLFWLSPVFCGAWWGIRRGRPRWSVWSLLATVVVVATPILLLMGTGWLQFGPRYTLDFTVPLLLLTALGIRRWPPPVVGGLMILSIVQYVIGTLYLSLSL